MNNQQTKNGEIQFSNVEQHIKNKGHKAYNSKTYGIVLDLGVVLQNHEINTQLAGQNIHYFTKLKFDLLIKLLQKLVNHRDSENDNVFILVIGTKLQIYFDLIQLLEANLANQDIQNGFNYMKSNIQQDQKFKLYLVSDVIYIMEKFQEQANTNIDKYFSQIVDQRSIISQALSTTYYQLQDYMRNRIVFDFTQIIITQGNIFDPKNEGDPQNQINKIRTIDFKINIMTFYIDQKNFINEDQTQINQKQLFDFRQNNLDRNGKLLMNLSSSLYSSSMLLMQMYLQGWQIVSSAKNKLLFSVQNADLIDEFPDNFMRCIHHNDALVGSMSRITLADYIQGPEKNYKPPKTLQNYPDYYSGCAAGIHLAMSTFYHREGDFPSYEKIREQIKEEYKSEINQPHTYTIIYKYAQQFRLYSRRISEKEAKFQILGQKPVLARLSLDIQQWEIFQEYFKHNPKGTLNRRNFLPNCGMGSHIGLTVNLVGFDTNSLIFFNQWGKNWGDNGFFRLQQEGNLVIEFYELYQDSNNLTENEKQSINYSGNHAVNDIFMLQTNPETQEYQCPSCNKKQKLSSYIGDFLEVKCSSCQQQYSLDNVNKELQTILYFKEMIGEK
ncbi:hypothetical protein PPERSA_07430 [Pseudocohnilembus persalinus]|uniref:Peptidase C1A papain C-terminal domain-containing protein n=1 Tax=Pseudocohnilembus persalinus TaxID=266149 RepID=A0A0V0QAC9_PSEPJ|nr:hypothetical protein PPERSA_07430 [Pseudocohnilembus persalinus]|eukprot:KRW99187.1 hypothetical protein PPERSA_07430 [Pseudocohnilembus persalinus]